MRAYRPGRPDNCCAGHDKYGLVDGHGRRNRRNKVLGHKAARAVAKKGNQHSLVATETKNHDNVTEVPT